jgi:hypothetical protein
MLAMLIERSKGMAFFDGLVPHLVEDGLLKDRNGEPERGE